MGRMSERAHYLTPDADNIDDRIDILLRAMSATHELHNALQYPGFKPSTFGYDKGQKYSRIWHNNGTQTFVCFFVERATGDVWKADGWKGPARNFVRGNINTTEGIVALTVGKMVLPVGYWYPGIG
jgi:hypothetical protein